MKTDIERDLRSFAWDATVGLALFTVFALLLLGGELPPEIPRVANALSIHVEAAEAGTAAKGLAGAKSFQFNGGWPALVAMGVMFAALYAFNLALLRRLRRRQVVARRRRLSTP